MSKLLTPSVFESTILPKVEEYTLLYLSTPTLWSNRYTIRDGGNVIKLFYDDETSKHMKGRSQFHLIDLWYVSFTLSGTNMKCIIDNSKMVGTYKLIDLLAEGTDDYTSDDIMHFWSRFDAKWHSTHTRKGIRPKIVAKFNKLIDDAIEYGGKRAVREWRLS